MSEAEGADGRAAGMRTFRRSQMGGLRTFASPPAMGQSSAMTGALTIRFGAHVSLEQVAGMVSSIAAYGHVWPSVSDRDFTVEVFRASKFDGLKRQLVSWERYGFLRWDEPTQSTSGA